MKSLNPCIFDREMLRHVGEEGTQLLARRQVDELEALCHKLMRRPDTGNPYRHFYKALRVLPPRDGLALATTVLLATAEPACGGDLVRMANNVQRLRDWERERPGGGPRVLTLKMDRDWSGDMYEASLGRLTEFLLTDLSGTPQEGGTAPGAAQRELVARVQEEGLFLKKNGSRGRQRRHFTRDVADREELKGTLRDDKLFGPILSGLQAIIDAV